MDEGEGHCRFDQKWLIFFVGEKSSLQGTAECLSLFVKRQ